MLFLSGILTAVGFYGFNKLAPSDKFWINAGSQAICYGLASFLLFVSTMRPSFLPSNAPYLMHPTFWTIGK
jgi:hypothetical protein